jgi:drug/metabolite transporter (DMT)-like permease
MKLSQGSKHMLLATFFFSLMNIFIKAAGHLPIWELVFFRCGISALISFVEIKRQGVDWKGSNRKLLILRGLFGTTALYMYFTTLANMSLGTAVTIQYLSPIFTTIIAIFILKERVRPVEWVFFIISFSGVYVMKGFDDTAELKYIFIGICSAVFSGLAYNMVRSLKGKEHPTVVVLHFQLLGALAGGIFSVPAWEMPQGWDWFYLLMTGITTQLGQVNMTKALQKEAMAKVTILNYLGVLYAIALGYFIFNESYTIATIGGIILVISGVILSIAARQSKRIIRFSVADKNT